jgi:hypothetical protein
MTLADVPAGTSVFVDANILIVALTNHPTDGAGAEPDTLHPPKSRSTAARPAAGRARSCGSALPRA